MSMFTLAVFPTQTQKYRIFINLVSRAYAANAKIYPQTKKKLLGKRNGSLSERLPRAMHTLYTKEYLIGTGGFRHFFSVASWGNLWLWLTILIP